MDIWFTVFFGDINTHDDGATERNVKASSGEIRLTVSKASIAEYRQGIHQALDIAIDNLTARL